MTASAGEPSPASKAARPPKQVVRTDVMPSTSTCKLVPSSRLVSAAARVDAAMFRFKTASADANQAGVAGMLVGALLNLVAAVHGDDTAAEIVIARLDETRGTQHFEQGFLIRMHADRFREIAIAVSVLGDESAERR
jgi:hypothetical protein